MKNISTETRFIGLLGYPLKQSYSPAMHNGAFEKLGLNKIYIPIEVTAEDFGDVIKGIAKMNFDGLNVTKPHKISVIPYLDEIDDMAKIIGAVNVVTIKNGRLKGYNSDGPGFYRAFEEETGEKVKDKIIFILGSGGAARAIAITLAMKEVKKIYICNRTFDKAAGLAADINKKVKNCAQAVPLNFPEMAVALKDTEVVINTTSVGMLPEPEGTPLDKKLLDKGLIVCDIVYNPLKTRLLQEAEKSGCITVTGISMMLYQGTESFELWTGLEPPVEAMSSIVRRLIL